MQAELNIDGLINALSSDDKLIRQRAATALRSLTATSALPALQLAYRVEDDPQTQFIIASAIEVLQRLQHIRDDYSDDHDQKTIHRLIKALQAEKPETIIKAAQRLGAMGDKLAVEPLIMVFNNPKHTIHVRLAVAESLLQLESAPVEVALLANLRHTDWHIRRNGAAILGQLKAEWAIEPLSKSLADPHPVVRRTALAALKHIGTPESRKALAQFSLHETDKAANKAKMPSEVSGIRVKRPGQQSDDQDNAESALLRRLRKQRREAERARIGTQPLNPDTIKKHAKRIQATQPLPDDLLQALNDDLEGDDK